MEGSSHNGRSQLPDFDGSGKLAANLCNTSVCTGFGQLASSYSNVCEKVNNFLGAS
jgi:hypothetical protein